MRETKMSKFYLLLQVGKKSSINWMKTVTSERCNTHTLYQSVGDIFPNIINNI